MSMNPYVAPHAPEPPPNMPPPPGGGPPLYWEIGEVISQAWALFKPNWGPLVGSMFLGQMIGSVPRILINAPITAGQVTPYDDAYWPLVGAGAFVGIIIQSFFQAGWMKMWLAAARGQPVNFSDLFSGLKKFFPMLGVTLLLGLSITAGSLLLCVPGVILGLGFMLAQWFVVDQNMGAIDAMKASWRATTGQKGKLLGFAFMSVLVVFLGYLACCIGVFASLPVAMIASAIVYLRLTGQPSFDPTAPAAYYPPQGPPGGYGGPPGPGGYGPPPPGGFGG